MQNNLPRITRIGTDQSGNEDAISGLKRPVWRGEDTAGAHVPRLLRWTSPLPAKRTQVEPAVPGLSPAKARRVVNGEDPAGAPCRAGSPHPAGSTVWRHGLSWKNAARRHHSGSEFIRAADPCNPWLHGIVPAYSAALVLWPREMPAACSLEIFSSTSGHLLNLAE
jgi:hypothetical protein